MINKLTALGLELRLVLAYQKMNEEGREVLDVVIQNLVETQSSRPATFTMNGGTISGNFEDGMGLDSDGKKLSL